MLFASKAERNRWFSGVGAGLGERQWHCVTETEHTESSFRELGGGVEEERVDRGKVVQGVSGGYECLGTVGLSLRAVNGALVDQQRKMLEGATRRAINLVDLKNLNDSETSRTNLELKALEKEDEEEILCFLDGSENEESRN